MLALQRRIGNAAVARLVQERDAEARSGRRVLARQPVSIATPGIDSPDEVMRFFRGYDADQHLERALAALSEFSGGDGERGELRTQFRTRFRGHFRRLGERRSGRGPLERSLETMSSLEHRDEMSLAASFVIGFRESGRNLVRNRRIDDTFWQSGLDHLFTLQGTLRREGFLPRGLRFAEGQHFGDDNPEAPGTIESARVEAPDVFLAHSAYVAHAGRRFADLAASFGFSTEDLAGLTDVQRNFWTALTFAGPGGARWDSGDRGYGAITLLSYLLDHGLPLSGVSRILELEEFRSRRRTRIAVRTAALITGLESMMREYAEGRQARRRAAAESGSEYDILEAHSATGPDG